MTRTVSDRLVSALRASLERGRRKLSESRDDDSAAGLFLLFVATTIWVGVDASGRAWRDHGFANATWKWVVGLLLLWDRCVSDLPRSPEPDAAEVLARRRL